MNEAGDDGGVGKLKKTKNKIFCLFLLLWRNFMLLKIYSKSFGKFIVCLSENLNYFQAPFTKCENF